MNGKKNFPKRFQSEGCHGPNLAAAPDSAAAAAASSLKKSKKLRIPLASCGAQDFFD